MFIQIYILKEISTTNLLFHYISPLFCNVINIGFFFLLVVYFIPLKRLMMLIKRFDSLRYYIVRNKRWSLKIENYLYTERYICTSIDITECLFSNGKGLIRLRALSHGYLYMSEATKLADSSGGGGKLLISCCR